ncbi:MAG: DUF742 domain-containing protein [Actinobacteria bacterium]|nr:DUF742 domain-containing protein [Actinomycetota bacterium]
MSSRPVDRESPDRFYTVTGGRTGVGGNAFDLVSLIVSKHDPAPGMQSEHVRILQECHRPTSVVEISSLLGLPVTVVKILLYDLLAADHISVRHPSAVPARAQLPDQEVLNQVLIGLQKL